jgi:hypothetical protein
LRQQKLANPQALECISFNPKKMKTGVQYVTLQKHFSHPSLVIYFFVTPPTDKTERGTANRWGTTNSKPPGRIIMIGQSKRGIGSQIIFITLFSSKCTVLLCLLPASAN